MTFDLFENEKETKLFVFTLNQLFKFLDSSILMTWFMVRHQNFSTDGPFFLSGCLCYMTILFHFLIYQRAYTKLNKNNVSHDYVEFVRKVYYKLVFDLRY